MAVNGTIQLGYKDSAWFTANPTLVLLAGQIVYLDDQSGTYKLGDGVTDLATLTFLGGSGGGGSQSLQDVTDIGATTTNLIEVGGLDNTDKLITLNKGGASSTGSGLQIEESGSIVGYIKTATGSAFDFLHPLNAFYARVALNLLTANRTYNLPDTSGTLALTSDVDTKLPIQATQTTGVALTFLTDSVYGTIGTPETGNVTYSATNAKIGVTNLIIHNSGTYPTFGTNMRETNVSKGYSLSVINYISVTYINSTEVIYTIFQRA